MVQSDRYWKPFCKAIGCPELVDDPLFSTADSRRINSAEIVSFLDNIFATKDRSEWEKILSEEGDFIFQSIQKIYELDNDPQVIANRYIVDFDHPVLGKVKMLNCTVTFSQTPAAITRPAPELGEHAEEVLLEAGYT